MRDTTEPQQDVRPAAGIAIALAAGPVLWAIATMVVRLIALR